jgi:hypothetical protein
MQRIRGRLTYANVMATLAVFLVLGGIGYAAATINGKDIKKHSEPGNRLKNHTLTAKQVRAPKVHLVGNPGEPIFLSGCKNLGGSDLLVGFFKDDQGVVHLQGAYYDCGPQTAGTVAFQLPQGYRPPPGKELKFPMVGGIAFVGGNGVPAGAVQCNKDPICQLDGITFRGS